MSGIRFGNSQSIGTTSVAHTILRKGPFKFPSPLNRLILLFSDLRQGRRRHFETLVKCSDRERHFAIETSHFGTLIAVSKYLALGGHVATLPRRRGPPPLIKDVVQFVEFFRGITILLHFLPKCGMYVLQKLSSWRRFSSAVQNQFGVVKRISAVKYCYRNLISIYENKRKFTLFSRRGIFFQKFEKKIII